MWFIVYYTMHEPENYEAYFLMPPTAKPGRRILYAAIATPFRANAPSDTKVVGWETERDAYTAAIEHNLNMRFVDVVESHPDNPVPQPRVGIRAELKLAYEKRLEERIAAIEATQA